MDGWTDCPPKPGCITVNVGDPLQFWSDGLLKSNYHRVRMPKEGEPLVRPRTAPRTCALWMARKLLSNARSVYDSSQTFIAP